MAAFSYDNHHSLLLDSSPMFLFPNTSTPANPSSDTTTNMSCFLEQSIHNTYKPCFSPYQNHPFFDQAAHPTVDVSSSVNISNDSTRTTKISTCSNNSGSSAVVTALCHQVINPMEKRKNNFQQPHSKLKGKKQRKETTSSNIDEGFITMRSEEKLNNKIKSRRSWDNDKRKKKKIGDQETKKNEALTGYVHVRARRGQATDTHSLAERVRREKISERMKLLQALVPGCDKVTGKALMLDEIINYVQSLQYQVEFLSLKIASVNPMLYDYGVNLDAFIVEPEVQNQRRSSLEATKQPDDVQQQNHTQATNNILNTSGGYSLMDASISLQLQQAQMSNIMSQPQVLWDVDEQRQKIISHSAAFTNNLSSLHLH